MKKSIKIFLICAAVLLGVIYALREVFDESTLAQTIITLICAPLAIAIGIVLCVDAVKQVNKNKQNNDLTERQKKWKKAGIITLMINYILMCIHPILSAVREITTFNSTASDVLSIIFCVLTFTNLIVVVISWCKIFLLNSLIKETQEEDSTENDNAEQ